MYSKGVLVIGIVFFTTGFVATTTTGFVGVSWRLEFRRAPQLEIKNE